jgi:hypothetical protein
MKLGTEDKKKTALAGGLCLVAAVTLYVQFFSGGAGTSRPPAARPQGQAASSTPQAAPARGVAAVTRPRVRRQAGNDFEPIWRQSHEGEFDPLASDPTLRTDLLAAVREVPMGDYGRNIFEYGERRRIVEPLSEAEIKKATEKAAAPPPPPPPAPVQAAAAPPQPKAPRLTWKYYGFASPTGDGKRRAFLLDGEHVLIGAEDDVFRGRYKVKRVGLTSIIIEDLQYSEEQTLPITAPAS